MKTDYPPAFAGLAFLFIALAATAADSPVQQPPAAGTASTAPAATATPNATPLVGTARPATPPAAPPMDRKQASYDFGLTFGEQLRRNNLNNDVDVDTVVRGLRDGLGGKKTDQADLQSLKKYVTTVRESIAPRNHQAARDFLQKNGRQKGVITTPSGLQYRVVVAGDSKAASPQPVDQVTVNYRGKLIDGTEFDSSYARGQPATFQASRVIKGWQEALGLMKPGDKWQLFIPPELAYDLASPPGIPPGSLLIFDVELLRVDLSRAAQAK